MRGEESVLYIKSIGGFVQFLETFFLISDAWFWILLAIVWVAVTAFEEIGRGTAATVTLGLFATAVFVANPHLLVLVKARPLYIAIGLVVYILIGTLWGIVKWTSYTRRWSDRIVEAQLDWRRNEKKSSSDLLTRKEARSMWQSVYNKLRRYEYYERNEAHIDEDDLLDMHPRPLLAVDNKARIMTWMSYWPFSALWTAINDPMLRIWLMVYRRIGKLLDRIGERAAKRVQVNVSPDPLSARGTGSKII